ncbi:MAG: anti-sigma factor [Sphingomonas bacterium]|nr:anti-sigma factor [Sphingomonas bacterium]
MTEEEEFFAWLDGELDSDAAARVERRVAADPALAEQAEAHRSLAATLRGAFDPVMKAAVPDRIVAAPIDLAAARDRRAVRGSGLPQWAALAATLALGLGLGAVVGGRGGQQSPVAIEDGQMVAGPALDRALNVQLASAPSGAATRIGVSFRDQSGAVCRSFEGAAESGLACRDGDKWRIEGLFGAGGGGQGDYRMAAGSDLRLAGLIEAKIAGELLDAAGEQAAKANGWR